MIGGGDWAASTVIVPDAIRSLADGKPIPVRNPKATRPWQHVIEPLAGYLRLAEALSEESNPPCEAFNFGPSLASNRPVAELVDSIIHNWPISGWTKATHQHHMKPIFSTYRSIKLKKFSAGNRSGRRIDRSPHGQLVSRHTFRCLSVGEVHSRSSSLRVNAMTEIDCLKMFWSQPGMTPGAGRFMRLMDGAEEVFAFPFELLLGADTPVGIRNKPSSGLR